MKLAEKLEVLFSEEKIQARVRELGTGQAHRFLREVQSKWPRKGSTRVKQAIDQAVLATSGSPGSEEGSP